MSTSTQPPSPRQEGHRHPFQQKVVDVNTNTNTNKHTCKYRRGPPPTAFDTQASTPRHVRSSSFGAGFSRFFSSHGSEKEQTSRPESKFSNIFHNLPSLPTPISRILPSRRSEKGHTLRHGFKLSNNSYDSSIYRRQLFEMPLIKPMTPPQPSRTNHEVSGPQSLGAVQQRVGSIRSNGRQSNHIDSQFEHPKPSSDALTMQELVIPNTRVYSNEKEITDTQRIYEDKKARRLERRCLRESGDFLGVQGANPRTGYWDMSDVTSSSALSQMSEAQRLLARQAEDVGEKKKQYEEAQLKQQIELQRVQALRDHKAAQSEQKRLEMRKRQETRAKWRLSDNGWSSTAEPQLSPIQQSLAGDPVTTELAPIYRLFPMPPTHNRPVPSIKSKPIKQRGDSHRHESSPLETGNRDHVKHQPSAGIPRSSALPSNRRTIDSSTSTIIHSVNIPPRRSSAEKHSRSRTSSFATNPESFLDQEAPSASNLPGGEAIAISSQSASASQVQNHQELDQNLQKYISPGKQIMSLKELPPVFIKDPIAARNPLSSQIPRANFPIWSPPTILETAADQSPLFTTTSITTIIGPTLPQALAQIAGVRENMIVAPAQIPMTPPFEFNRMTLHNGLPQREQQKASQSHESPNPPADIGTSSEPQLTAMRQRIGKLCQAASAKGENAGIQSTPTSISTSRRRPPTEHEIARNAAQVAFNHLHTDMAEEQTALVRTKHMRARRATSAPPPSDRMVVAHPEPSTRRRTPSESSLVPLVPTWAVLVYIVIVLWWVLIKF